MIGKAISVKESCDGKPLDGTVIFYNKIEQHKQFLQYCKVTQLLQFSCCTIFQNISLYIFCRKICFYNEVQFGKNRTYSWFLKLN